MSQPEEEVLIDNSSTAPRPKPVPLHQRKLTSKRGRKPKGYVPPEPTPEELEAKAAKEAKRLAKPRKKPKHVDMKKALELRLTLDEDGNPMPYEQIAKKLRVTPCAVSQAIKRLQIREADGTIDVVEKVKNYKEGRADLFAYLQTVILESISHKDLEKASLKDKTIVASILYDKERVERGQSTSNTSLFIQMVGEACKQKIEFNPKAIEAEYEYVELEDQGAVSG